MSESSTAVAERNGIGAIEQVLVQGNLAALTPEQRVLYYNRVCESIGLNPLTRPFEYLTLNGKLVLYARKDCTEQLRKIHSVSIEIKARELVGDCYVVTAKAMFAGRTDESIGAVSVAGLKGDAMGNAYMKAETKAKRRVTLSICGLGMLDETEVETIPGATIREPGDDGTDDALAAGREAATQGDAALKAWYESLDNDTKNAVYPTLRDLRATAKQADAAKVPV